MMCSQLRCFPAMVKLQCGYMGSRLSLLESSSVPLSKLLWSLSQFLNKHFCILTILSLQIEIAQNPCLGWTCKNYFRKRTGTFWRKEAHMGWRHNVEVYMAPGFVLICTFAQEELTVTADLGNVISLKEFSSTGLLVFFCQQGI